MTLFEEVARMNAVQYVCEVHGRRHRFETLDEAKAYASRVFAKTGIVLGIEATARHRHSGPFAKRGTGLARRIARRNKQRTRELALA